MTGKKPTGITRIIKATGFTVEGLKAAWKNEAAFRQESLALAVLIPLGLFLGRNGAEKALLILSPMIVIVTELLNSGLESVVDRIGPEYHPLSKRVKDMGSAAVFVSITAVVITWMLVLI